ncbi:hypothetical protein AL036_06165 [Salipiger aestuarii]|uniref:Plastocyanin n=1 Tax=Salipiger aestuarii TaxID=568098 RepID=A0A327YDB2_9RHOB|nr:hypothetical protein [Salipiger aestuarii]EIE52749.1 hypothetical protein C357_01949 [Citreicella sp. 357]KAA8608685.1 hypothetical protein AL036_06165 [Salipiger aestuarii]KAA8613082.1 hypothetical protein AL037_06105 [Salipiger aestuarii]KAB2542552.1 hypothetical protein AL035_06580 [Salipiger aestuarii]RAK19028.1 hypothetical protein ATI53_101070 [Salipiger aestuarii]
MLRKTGILALSLGLLAAPAMAEVHYVLLMGDGYFPDYVYPAVGDQVKFVNESDITMAATATDGSWTTGVMLPGAVVMLDVTDGMTQTFVDSENTAGLAAGTIDYFNPAPLDLENNASSN